MFNSISKTMTGTTGTTYTTVATLKGGGIGFRELGGGEVRVRVEPFGPGTLALSSADGWSQPQGGYGTASHRYSKVVKGYGEFAVAVLQAIKAVQAFNATPAPALKPAPATLKAVSF